MVDEYTEIMPIDRRRREGLALSGAEARYLIDRAVSNAERITPYQHEWMKKNPDGSIEAHKVEGIRIDLRKDDVQKFAKNVIRDNKTVFDRLADL